MLFAGTTDGIYRMDGPRFDDAEKVLDTDTVMRVRQFEGWDPVFAATKSGLYRSTDGGDSWTDLGVPRKNVCSVLGDSARERLYAGTRPAHLYVSEDEGQSWQELEGFQTLPSREEWYSPSDPTEAQIRSLDDNSEAPDRVVAGVEVGGVHVSDDRAESWTERKRGVHDDVHHVNLLGPDEYVASTGGGLYRTEDAGENWTRLDSAVDQSYFRESFTHGGVLYAAAAHASPGTWEGERGADAALFESEDDGDTLERVSYPGGPEEVILGWTAHDGNVVAGTNDGRVIVRTDDEWVEGGRIPAWIKTLCAPQ